MKAAIILAILLAMAYFSRTSGIRAGDSFRNRETGEIVRVLQVHSGFVYFSGDGYIDGTMFKILYARIN